MTKVKIFTFNNFQVNTYLLYDDSKEAIIIDPACDSDEEFNALSDYIAENELKLKAVVNTHGHIDHIVGIDKVTSHYKVPFSINKEDEFLLDADTARQSAMLFGFSLETPPVPDTFINNEDKIEFGNSVLKAIHVPGHSPGSIVFYCEESKFVVVGDVLFSGSIGRTDLPGGSYETLISGIKTRLMNLPGDVKVYCGHGPFTTIQQEHDTNPFLV